MTPAERGIIYAAAGGRFEVGDLLLPSSSPAFRPLAFLQAEQLLASKLDADEQIDFQRQLNSILEQIPDARLRAADSLSPSYLHLEDLLLAREGALPDSFAALTESVNTIVASPDAPSLLLWNDYIGIVTLSGILPPPPSSAVLDSISILADPPPAGPFVENLVLTEENVSAREGTVTHDEYGGTFIVGGATNGPHAGGGAVVLTIPNSIRTRLVSATFALDTGGAFGSGHFYGKGIHSLNGAPIEILINGHVVHVIQFPETSGLYGDRWAMPATQSVYAFAADLSDVDVTGPIELRISVGSGSVMDVRSIQALLHLESAVFTDVLPTAPVIGGAPIRQTVNPQPTIAWQDVARAETFQVVVINDWTGAVEDSAAGLTTPQFTPTRPLAPGGYWVWVRGRNHLGDSPWASVHIIVDSPASDVEQVP